MKREYRLMYHDPLLARTPGIFRGCRVFALLATGTLVATIGGSAPLRGSVLRAQATPAPETIGSLVGDEVTVKNAISFDVSNGHSSALLASGSEITVRSGKARIDLGDGDSIAVCGPAHFTIIKAGGTLTLALDYGEVHSQLNSTTPLTIYMPLIVATPVAIGAGPRDLTVGLDQAGSLCALTASGALRVEEQLGGQGLLVPQGGQVSFSGGELNAVAESEGACSCELLVVADTVKRQFSMNLQVQPPSQPVPSQPITPAPAPSLNDAPVYRITVPLTFDARAPRPPAGDPPTIVLDEEARLQTQIYFQGDVRPAPPPQASRGTVAKNSASSESGGKKPGPFAKLFGIFHRRHSEAPCAGAGCGANS
jgi:hypothetical protein